MAETRKIEARIAAILFKLTAIAVNFAWKVTLLRPQPLARANPWKRFENYSSSLLSTFTSHAKYIDEYRAHIIHLYPDRRAYTVFFIDDITALGNYIRTPKGLQVLYPLMVKDFITTISKMTSLDYVVLKFKQRIYEPLLLIVKNKARYLDIFKQEYFNPETDAFIQYTYEHEGHIHRMP